ncbi:alcohol dehydrogenase catalytic domain-containing protein [Candidatus Poribacteria bacterium]|nr:alcohol dehydrogenase catalytic domain-containing protein [Candidatus Poribacteria bacterium]
MKAGIVYGPGKIGVGEFHMPKPGYSEVLIKVKAAGICGSDLHYHRSDAPISENGRMMGGHELSGEIVAVGDGVKNREVGQRVGIEPLLGCDDCEYCTMGQYHLCSRLTHPGGGFREYTAILAKKAFPIPGNVSYEEAALLDCLTVGVHAVHRGNVGITDSVAVIGDAAIGFSTLEVAKAAGAKKIILIGHHDENLDVGKKVGADVIINSADVNDIEAVMEATNGQGCDVVFETVGGTADTLDTAVKIARTGGRIVIIGMFRKPLSLEFGRLMRNEIDIIFSWSYSTWNGIPEFAIALELLARGELDAEALITHKYPIDKISDAFEAALNKRESGALKVLITYD